MPSVDRLRPKPFVGKPSTPDIPPVIKNAYNADLDPDQPAESTLPVSPEDDPRIQDISHRLRLVMQAGKFQHTLFIDRNTLVQGQEQRIKASLDIRSFYEKIGRPYPSDLSPQGQQALDLIFWSHVSRKVPWNFDRERQRLHREDSLTEEEKQGYIVGNDEAADYIDAHYDDGIWDEQLGTEARVVADRIDFAHPSRNRTITPKGRR